jgi:hypothetical protein
VRKLTFEACSVSLGVIEAFYYDCVFDSLESLTVIDTYLDEDAWEKWVFHPWWKNLRALYVADKRLSDQLAEALTWGDGLELLQDLTLRSEVLTDSITHTLATAKLSPTLRTFSLESPQIGAEGWSNLLQQKALPEDSRKLFLERSRQKPKTKFDKLNALLAGDVGSDEWRDALLSCLSAAHRKSPASYKKTWIPHLEAQPIAWPDPFEFETLGPKWLERGVSFLPAWRDPNPS